MAAITGSSGELRYRGKRVSKCREFSVDISRDALETTVLGDWDRTYTEGIRGATGSATVLYDESDTATVDLANSIFSNNSKEQIGLILNTITNKRLEFSAIVTQASIPVTINEVTVCSVSFQVTGPFDSTF